jgi:hypothetical protein
MSSYTLRAASRGAWRVNWSAEALGLGAAARTYDSDGEEIDAAPATPEEHAAVAAGLDAAFPSRAERRAFAKRLGRRSGVQVYLSVRRVRRRGGARRRIAVVCLRTKRAARVHGRGARALIGRRAVARDGAQEQAADGVGCGRDQGADGQGGGCVVARAPWQAPQLRGPKRRCGCGRFALLRTPSALRRLARSASATLARRRASAGRAAHGIRASRNNPRFCVPS